MASVLSLLSFVSANRQQTRHADIEFAGATHPRLDVYTPNESPDDSKPRPVIVFFYGGSWQRGSKNTYRFVASELTRQGYVVVMPDYRLYPQVVFPEFIEDAAAAVRWAIRNADSFGGDPSSVFLMGHSAGAQIAALLHYDTGYLADDSAAIAGMIGLSGPYDFLPLTSKTLESVFPEPSRAASQPINYAHGAAAPALLLHGGKDTTVGAGNSVRLARKISAAGGVVDTRIYQSRGHAGLLLALARPMRSLAPVVSDVSAFVEAKRETRRA